MSEWFIVFKIYPKGFPVTSKAHATDDEASKTVCGITLDGEWQFDEWGSGPECKKCLERLKGANDV